MKKLKLIVIGCFMGIGIGIAQPPPPHPGGSGNQGAAIPYLALSCAAMSIMALKKIKKS